MRGRGLVSGGGAAARRAACRPGARRLGPSQPAGGAQAAAVAHRWAALRLREGGGTGSRPLYRLMEPGSAQFRGGEMRISVSAHIAAHRGKARRPNGVCSASLKLACIEKDVHTFGSAQVGLTPGGRRSRVPRRSRDGTRWCLWCVRCWNMRGYSCGVTLRLLKTSSKSRHRRTSVAARDAAARSHGREHGMRVTRAQRAALCR